MKQSMHTLHRLLALVLVLVMVGSLFAGCSKKDPDPTNPSEPSETVGQTDAPTDEPTDAPTEEPTDAPTEPEVTVPPVIMGTVNADNLNVRSEPFSTADILKRLAINTRIEVLEQKIVDGVNWGRIPEGWINLNYVTIDGEGTTPGTDGDNVVDNENALSGGNVAQEGNGTITATELHIRESADANSKSKGTYKKGDKVTVLERKGDWGRTKDGWINLTHVTLTGTVPTSSGSGATNTGSGSGSGSSSTGSISTTVSNGNKAVLGHGTVKGASSLAVRTGPGTQYEQVGYISLGQKVDYFQRSNGWARIKNGWVSEKYLELEYAIDPGTEGVVNTGELNVREKADSESDSLATLEKGDEVVIMEVDGIWGKIEYEAGEYGWINLDYIKFPASVTSSYTTGKGTVNTGALNYREEPDADSKSLGTYKQGDRVEITEVDGHWGLTDKGWVNLKYIKMDEETTYRTGEGKVTASGLNIRSKASASGDDLGTLTKGTKVTILEVDGNWGKIEYKSGKYGWINLKYVEMVLGDKHTVTIAGSANGTVKAGATKFAAGATVTLTVSPNSGYQLDKLAVKDEDDTNVTVSGYKFVMPDSDVTVTATFKKATSKYTVTVNTSKFGKVTASTTSCYPGTEVAISVAPKSGYVLDTLTAMNTTDNTTVAVSGGAFTMPEGNVNVVATFKEASTTYSVATSTSSYGKIVVSSTAAESGETITLNVKPNSGYELDELTVKNATTNDTIPVSGSDNTYTFEMPASKVTVSATYKTAKYTVTIISPAHGSISVNPDTYAKGAKVTLVVTPDEGYELDKMTFTNTEDYTTAISGKSFTMPGDDVYVEASFKKIKYEIHIYEPDDGAVTVDKAKHGINETVTLTIKPDSGYELDTLTVKNATTKESITVSGSGNTRTFVMPASKVNISARFKVAPKSYSISIGSISNGTVTADKASAKAGETVTLTVTPNSGYELDTLTVNGNAITGTTFTMPEGKATVAATFKELPATPYTVSIGTITNGTVSADKTSATAGETVTLTVTPNSGYELDTLTVNGDPVTGTTFTMPAADATVAATFKAVRTLTVTVTDAEGNPLSGVSVAIYTQHSGFSEVASAKTSNSSGKITFTTSELTGVASGMRLVAEVKGSHTWADQHPVRDAVAGLGVTFGQEDAASSNDWLDVTADSNEPISGSFTIRVKSAG